MMRGIGACDDSAALSGSERCCHAHAPLWPWSVRMNGRCMSTGIPTVSSMRHCISWGIMLAFLLTATHMIVDHGAGGQSSFALFSHPCPSHTHDDDQPPTTHHHDESDASSHDHHQANTHDHGMWSTPAADRSALHCSLGFFDAGILIAAPIAAPASSLYHALSPPSLRGCLLSLRWSVLRI
jgi:hypothetical protein